MFVAVVVHAMLKPKSHLDPAMQRHRKNTVFDMSSNRENRCF